MDSVDRAVEQERAFIARCDDVQELLDRMADYRDHQRAAISRGDTRLRLRTADLLDLAEDRITTIKASRRRRGAPATDHDQRPPRQTPPPPSPSPSAPESHHQTREAAVSAAPPASPKKRRAPEQRDAHRTTRPRAEQSRRTKRQVHDVESELERVRTARLYEEQERQEAEERAAQARSDARRLARLRAQLRREQAAKARAARERQAAEKRAAVRERMVKAQQVALDKVEKRGGRAGTGASPQSQADESSRSGRAPVERPAPAEAQPRGGAPVSDRRRQRRDASTSSPASINQQSEQPRRNRSRHVPAEPTTPASIKRDPMPATRSTDPQPAAPEVSSTKPDLNGADLRCFRAERGITQRSAAEQLGVAHGTVAKAELAPTKPLGPKLQEALLEVVQR